MKKFKKWLLGIEFLGYLTTVVIITSIVTLVFLVSNYVYLNTKLTAEYLFESGNTENINMNIQNSSALGLENVSIIVTYDVLLSNLEVKEIQHINTYDSIEPGEKFVLSYDINENLDIIQIEYSTVTIKINSIYKVLLLRIVGICIGSIIGSGIAISIRNKKKKKYKNTR